jgi:hypothetical protein
MAENIGKVGVDTGMLLIIGGLALVSIVSSAFLDEEPNRRR